MKTAQTKPLFALLLVWSAGAALAQPVVVRPQESDELLANPGIGWETFHRTSNQDKNLPSWIPSTMQYARWGWGQLEPQRGRLDTGFLDRVLKETHASGQKLAFRVMCCSTTRNAPYQPRWLKGVGREILAHYGSDSFLIPDFDDPAVLEAHLDLIRRLGERYDGHPDIDHIDIGSIGWWGEWHLSGSKQNRLPTLENRMKVVDAYLAAFRKTPLLMLIGGRECLSYATRHGAGWRADCLGDMGGFSKSWCHMLNGYPAYIRDAGIQDVWKTAPAAFETCWDMRKWVSEGWSLRYIFNYALACHASIINNKSAPLPPGANVRGEIERFLRRLGYRLVLREFQNSPTAKPGQKLELAMKWQNVGSAPCYKPYRLAYRLSRTDGYGKVFISPVAVNRWLPGSIEMFMPDFFKQPGDLPPGPLVSVSDSISMPADVPAGRYTLSIAVVDAASSSPIIKLSIKGRAPDGWYPISNVEIVR